MLLDNTNKHRMYPTKPETEGAISSLDNLTVICSSEEITNDVRTTSWFEDKHVLKDEIKNYH